MGGKPLSGGAGMSTESDWDVLLSFLPDNWEELAVTHGAVKRLRGFASAEVLLRTMLIHLGHGCSLRETAVRAQRGGIASVSDVAILKRLRQSEEWLHALCVGICHSCEVPPVLSNKRFRLIAADATCISEPGSTGTNWKLHYALEIPSLNCVHFELTGPKEAEKLERYPLQEGDLVLADRVYCGAKGLKWVLEQKAHALVRMKVSQKNFNLKNESTFFDHLDAAKDLAVGESIAWEGELSGTNRHRIPGRLCLLRRSDEIAEMERARILRAARQDGCKPRQRTLQSAAYVGLFTTLPPTDFAVEQLFEMYHFRWQVELAFKRLKSITDFGHLPKRDPGSCRAWLYGKLLIGLLVDKMAQAAFFP